MHRVEKKPNEECASQISDGDIETCVKHWGSIGSKIFHLVSKMIAIENWCCIGRTGGYRRLTFRDLFSQRLQAFCQFWMWYDTSYGENAYNFRHDSETHETCANLEIMAFNYPHWRVLPLNAGLNEIEEVNSDEMRLSRYSKPDVVFLGKTCLSGRQRSPCSIIQQ